MISPPHRLLLGPGPSQVHPRVLEAISKPPVGHLDPYFLELMDSVRSQLRQVFQTENEMTLPISGTGSAGMETCLVNLLEPGDSALIFVNGVFGQRMAEVARRCGAEVDIVEAEWGSSFNFELLAPRLRLGNYKIICAVQAETSTGVLQDLSGLRELADEHEALLVLDTVTSLGGVPLGLDVAGIDATYSGTQKCLSCPPGLSPVSFSARAMEVVRARTVPVQSWYLDLNLLDQYWGPTRAYHHTAPINMIYALSEALTLVLEEGLIPRWRRHRECSELLRVELEAMGLEVVVKGEDKLPPLTVVKIPEGIDDALVRTKMLEDYGIEIGGGLGPMKGKAWRIGLMGNGCHPLSVARCITSLKNVLARK